MKRIKIKTLKKQIKDNPIFDKQFKDNLMKCGNVHEQAEQKGLKDESK